MAFTAFRNTANSGSMTLENRTDDAIHTYKKKFPYRLHQLIDQAETDGYSHIISWLPGQNAFKVHLPKDFADHILPMYFATKTYKSFQRNLNLWGFTVVPKGEKRGVLSHPLFLKGKPELCRLMRRSRSQMNREGQTPIAPSMAKAILKAPPASPPLPTPLAALQPSLQSLMFTLSSQLKDHSSVPNLNVLRALQLSMHAPFLEIQNQILASQQGNIVQNNFQAFFDLIGMLHMMDQASKINRSAMPHRF